MVENQSSVGSNILVALESIFTGEEQKATANLANYIQNPVAIGEHPDLVLEARKLVEEIGHARHCKEIVQSMK